MSSGKRYKFNGSQFQVQTGLGTPKTVTDIDQANPGLVTSAAHGFVLGDVVKLSGISGMTGLNGNLYPVDNPATNDFELAGEDTTNQPAFVLDSPNNARATAAVFSNFCELTGADQQDGTAEEIPATTICSTAQEFEIGLSDSGSLSLDFNWAGNTAVQSAMRAAKRSGERIAFKITFPGDGGTVIMVGYVQATSFSGANNGLWTATATIRLTGEIFVLEAA